MTTFLPLSYRKLRTEWIHAPKAAPPFPNPHNAWKNLRLSQTEQIVVFLLKLELYGLMPPEDALNK